MRLSKRLPADLSDSPFFLELSHLKKNIAYADLTLSSPLKVGIPFDLSKALPAAEKDFARWDPDSAGWRSAREAVADYFRARGGNFDPEEILLTSSTSEAYSILFKTFCDPGDAVLTPMPGYPLLDTLASLEFLQTAPYFLVQENGKWKLDTLSLCTFPPKSRILLIVSPGNPTGHVISKEEWAAAVDFAAKEDLVIVVDEVFGDFIYDGSERPWRWDSKDVPVFFLGGFSKSVGSPQLKLGWMAYRPGRLGKALQPAVEFVSDAYLSVSSAAFALARPMLDLSLEYERLIEARTKENLATLRQKFPDLSVMPNVQGGWYAALHFDGEDDELLTLRLLEKGVLVQPGFLFDFDEDGWIVVSLLPDPETFRAAVEKIYLEVAE